MTRKRICGKKPNISGEFILILTSSQDLLGYVSMDRYIVHQVTPQVLIMKMLILIIRYKFIEKNRFFLKTCLSHISWYENPKQTLDSVKDKVDFEDGLSGSHKDPKGFLFCPQGTL